MTSLIVAENVRLNAWKWEGLPSTDPPESVVPLSDRLVICRALARCWPSSPSLFLVCNRAWRSR